MAEIHIRFNLDLPPCESRLGDILRARDRPKPPTGPLTAPCGAWSIRALTPQRHGSPRVAVSGPVGGLGRSRALRISPRRDSHGGRSRLIRRMDLRLARLLSQILEIENMRDRTPLSENQHRRYLDLPPCESRLEDIRRALDRHKPAKGPLTAPCGARTPTMAV